MSRILSHDADTQKSDIWHSQGDDAVVETQQDVTAIIEANKIDYNAQSGFRGDFHHVARIPLFIYEELQRKGIADDPDALKRWLDDPANRMFRTHPGRLSK
jgi:hypothetical protein